MKISVIIPFFDDVYALYRCCDAVLVNHMPYEIIVVNDNPKVFPETITIHDRVTVLCNDENMGPAFSRNRGAAVAQGDVLLFLDADVVISPTAFEEIRRGFQDTDSDIIQGVYMQVPLQCNAVEHYMSCSYQYKIRDIVVPTSVSSFCFAISRQAFDVLGGFDEHIMRATVEDNDLSMRIEKFHYTMMLNPALQCEHIKRYRSVFRVCVREYWMLHDMTKLFLRQRPLQVGRSRAVTGSGVHKIRLAVSLFCMGILIVCVCGFSLPFAPIGLCAALLSYIIVNMHFLMFCLGRTGYVRTCELLVIDMLCTISRLAGVLCGMATFAYKQY